MINVVCPEGHKLKVEERHAGKRVRCPKCSQVVTIPEASSLPPTPAANKSEPPQDELPKGRASASTTSSLERKSEGEPFGSTPNSAKNSERQIAETDVPGAKEEDDFPQDDFPPSVSRKSADAGADDDWLDEDLELPPRLPVKKRQASSENPRSKPIKTTPVEKGKASNPGTSNRQLLILGGAAGSLVGVAVAAVALFIAFGSGARTPTSSEKVASQLNPEASSNGTSNNGSASSVTSGTTAERPRVVIPFATPVKQLVVGGGGSHLIAALPDSKEVAVIDVAAGSVVKTIGVDDIEILVAGGASKFVVYTGTNTTLTRYDLASCQSEQSINCKPITTMAMGCESEGPVLVYGPASRFGGFDLENLREIPNLIHVPAAAAEPADFRLCSSANGKLFTGSRLSQDKAKAYVMELVGPAAAVSIKLDFQGIGIPTADGRFVCNQLARFESNWEMASNPSLAKSIRKPGATGSSYMTLESEADDPSQTSRLTKLSVHSTHDDRSMLTARDFTLPDVVQGSNPEQLPLHERVFWLPNSNAVVTAPSSGLQVIIHPFQLQQELEKGGEDYLFVTSSPQRNVSRGESFVYKIEALSKLAVSFDVVSAPNGMVVSKDGMVNWSVPADYSEQKTTATIRLQMAGGKELFHTFKLTLNRNRANPPPMTAPGRSPTPMPGRSTANRNMPPVVDRNTPPAVDPGPRVPLRQGVEIALPGKATQIVPAGSGRFLVALIPESKQVAVINVASRQVVKNIPVDGEVVVIAGGRDKFIIHQQSKGSISRFDLATQERELTLACEAYVSMALGSSSEGPLFALAMPQGPAGFQTPIVIDLGTLKPLSHTIQRGHPLMGDITLLAAAEGNVVSGWRNSGSPSGMFGFERSGDQWRANYEHVSYGPVLPSPDGNVFFASSGRFDSYCKKLSADSRTQSGIRLPATTGSFAIQLEIPNRNIPTAKINGMTIREQNDDTVLLTVSDLEFPPMPELGKRDVLPMYSRFFWMPEVNAITTVPSQGERLVLYDFDLKAEMDKSGIDYLIVTSRPPKKFEPGKAFKYPITVLSKNSPINFKLEDGPAGMKVSEEGVVEWPVPAKFPDHEFVALVLLSGTGGQQNLHTIKVSDGQDRPGESKSNSPPKMAANGAPMPARPPVNNPPTSASPPVPPINVTATEPKKEGSDHWTWNGSKPYFVRDEGGGLSGIMIGNKKLYRIAPNGLLQIEPLVLKSNYIHLGIRNKSKYLVGVTTAPNRLEIISEKGDIVRTVALPNQTVNCLSLHPIKPISYVSLDQTVDVFRGIFVTVDEQQGSMKEGTEELGQEISVDPTGRFLLSSYQQSIHVGDQLVVTQQPAGRAPMPSPRRGRGVPIPRHGPPGRQAQASPQIGIRHAFANVSLALVYDLEDPSDPTIHVAFPLKSPVGQLRVSHDGHRMISLPLMNKTTRFTAFDPLHRDHSETAFDLGSTPGSSTEGTDIAFHPVLPLAITAGNGLVRFLDADDGKSANGKAELTIPDISKSSIDRVMVSGDAKFVNIVAHNNTGEYTLVRKPVPVTSDERKLIEGRWLAATKTHKENNPPLSDVTAWYNAGSKDMSSAQITAAYADSVVIVRSGNKSGTGFFIGSSGLILTCAHCVSPLDEIQVIYHPRGKPDEKEMIEATIVKRDRKRDICLLNVDAEIPFHSVELADPIPPESGGNVTVISNPGLGTEILDNTVTTGVISNSNRSIDGQNYIQSSAAVNPGSSGGPMFNSRGQVIGVVVLKAGIEGVGFAVPPDAIAKFLLKATRQDGKHIQIVRDWMKANSTKLEKHRLVEVKKGTAIFVDKSASKVTVPIAEMSPGDRALLELISADE